MRLSAQLPAAARRRLAVLSCAVLAGAALPASALIAGPALAAPGPNCAGTPGTVICQFAYDTSSYSWSVPAGVTALHVTAYGGSGQGEPGGPGGAGAQYVATLTGAAGQTLSVTTGGAGTGRSGGTNGGGDGGTAVAHGGGGGGDTVITSGPNVLVVAGGGGGAGVGQAGGDAGTSSPTVPAATTGGNGSNSTVLARGGKGGSTVLATGGAAGNSLACAAATAGTALLGGHGANCIGFGGGGGGGGYFGGGGGGNASGGGGGSSYPAVAFTAGGITVAPGATFGDNTGNGKVIVTYLRVSTTTTLTSAPNPSNPGQPVTFTATVSPTDGDGTVEFDDNGDTISGCAAQPLTLQSGSTYTATCTTSTLPAGVDPVTATYSSDRSYLPSTSTPLDQHVVAAAPTRLRAFGQVTSDGHMYVSAQLTSNGSPASGQLITFTTVLAPTPVCTATTTGLGIATCAATGEAAVLIALGQGAFTASFAGSVSYRAAHAVGIIDGR